MQTALPTALRAFATMSVRFTIHPVTLTQGNASARAVVLGSEGRVVTDVSPLTGGSTLSLAGKRGIASVRNSK